VATACFSALISLIWSREKDFRQKAAQLIASVFMTTIPFLPHLLFRRMEMGKFWPDPPSFGAVIDTLIHPFMGIILALAYITFILAGLIIAIKRREQIQRIVILLLLGTLPLCGVIAVSLMRPTVSIMIPIRIAILFFPPVLFLAGIGFSTADHAGKFTGIAALVGFISLCALSVWTLCNNNYYTVPTKKPAREMIALLAEMEQENAGNILYVSLDPSWYADLGYLYYIKKIGFSGKIESATKQSDLPELSFFLRKAQREGKSRMVLFNISHIEDYHPVAAEADMSLDIVDAVMQVGPGGGVLVVYDLGSSTIEETEN